MMKVDHDGDVHEVSWMKETLLKKAFYGMFLYLAWGGECGGGDDDDNDDDDNDDDDDALFPRSITMSKCQSPHSVVFPLTPPSP